MLKHGSLLEKWLVLFKSMTFHAFSQNETLQGLQNKTKMLLKHGNSIEKYLVLAKYSKPSVHCTTPYCKF